MALIVNPHFRGTTSHGVVLALFNSLFDSANSGTRRLRVFPSTVPFPGPGIIGSYTVPNTHLLDYSALTFARSGNSIILQSGTLAVNAVATGTASWWVFYNGGLMLASDSIGPTGSGTIVTLSAMTMNAGLSVTVNFNLASL